MESTKEVVIGNSRYQIARVTSEDGSWLLAQTLASMRKVMKAEGVDDQEEPKPAIELTPEQQRKNTEEMVSAMVQSMLMEVDRELFARIQRYALGVCGEFTAVGENEIVLPVTMATGRIAIPKLKNDISCIFNLTNASLVFNLLPFFLDGGFRTTTS